VFNHNRVYRPCGKFTFIRLAHVQQHRQDLPVTHAVALQAEGSTVGWHGNTKLLLPNQTMAASRYKLPGRMQMNRVGSARVGIYPGTFIGVAAICCKPQGLRGLILILTKTV